MIISSLPNHAVQAALDVLFEHAQVIDEVTHEFIEDDDPVPKRKLKSLDRDAHSLQLLLEAFQDAVLRRLAHMRSCRNQLVPIYRLPPEVLILIFESAVDAVPISEYDIPSTFRSHYQVVTQLAQVSSFFRITIVSATQFWTKVDGTFDPLFVELILQRSNNKPLDVNIGHYHSMGKTRSDFLSDILQYCSRWRSFRISVEHEPLFTGPWLADNQMPLLEALELSWMLHSGDTPELPIGVQGLLPRLRHLSIASFNFPIGCTPFSRLESITMRSSIKGIPFNLLQWHMFLSSTPQLRILWAVGDTGFMGLPDITGVSEIHVPKLENLGLYSQPFILIGALLRSIIPALNCYPRVVIGDPRDHGSGLEAMFPEVAPDGSLLSKIRKMEWMAGNHHYDQFELKGGMQGGGELICLEARTIGADVFRSLIPSSGSPWLVSVKMNGFSFFAGGHFISAIRLCSRLKYLVLTQIGMGLDVTFDNLTWLCATLATPLKGDMESNDLSWPCPDLRHLEIRSNTDQFPSLLELVETRYGLISEDDGLLRLPAPVFLKELRLRGVHKSFSIRSEYPDLVNRLEEICQRYGTKICLDFTDEDEN